MDWVTIENVQPWDGRYPFDINTDGQELTVREWGWIKRLSGYTPLNVADGLSDPELLTVFALIALVRAGKVDKAEVPALFDRFQDVPFGGRIGFESDEAAEGDADPPGKLERERGVFWGRFEDEFGDIGQRPEALWDARLGWFSVRLSDVGELTPGQMLGCADLFAALHGGGD